MKLHCREYGERAAGRPTVLLLHGLFGSASNWAGIAGRLQGRFHVLVPDLRNHGRSPHHQRMDYPAMADDLRELMDDRRLDTVSLVGHSMGGKVAMWFALAQPEHLDRLVVADIAPVDYPPRFAPLFEVLERLDLAHLDSRTQADAILKREIHSRGLRAYLLQNLVRRGGGWAWRFNLPVLRRSRILGGFPAPADDRQFPGRTLFLYGGRSDYLTAQHEPAIRTLFPFARLRMIPEAGHWLYSEAPDAFLEALSPFLTDRGKDG